jgi:putative transposase
LLRRAGWLVNDKRVERIWRREGLKVPARQLKRGRLWLNDGSCVRLRAEHRNHVWSYDFVEDRTHNGRRIRMLNIIDEFTHECLAIRVARRLRSIDVIDLLSDLFILRGVPGHIRSDNGPEFIARAVQDWIAAVGARTAYIERGSPWENGFIESFNARLRDELLNGEIFYTSGRRRSSLRAGDGTTTPSGRMPRSDTRLPPRRCSCRRWPHRRLRIPDQLRRPCSHWRRGRP